MAVIVVRTSKVEEAKEFFTRLGLVFDKEQHGRGSPHYATQVGEDVFEIYPVKGDGPEGLAFMDDD